MLVILSGVLWPQPHLFMIEEDEQRITLAVTTYTKMTPSEWKDLKEYERVPWMEVTISKLMDQSDEESVKTPLQGNHTASDTIESKKDIPHTHREGGEPDGKPLGSTYLIKSKAWNIHHKPELQRLREDGTLTECIQVGKSENSPYYYSYHELINKNYHANKHGDDA